MALTFVTTTMVYETAIPLPDATLLAMRKSNADANEILLKDLQDGMTILVNLLRDYEYDKEVKGVIRTVDIAQLQFDTQGNGSFQATYVTNIFNGCRDVNYDEICTMKITFFVDITQRRLQLRGEDSLPKRDPDEF